MKKILFVPVLVLLFHFANYPQWYQQNSGNSSNLFFLQFLNSDTGWTIGPVPQEGYKLFKTTNGGTDWTDQGTILPSAEGFITNFFFLNNSTGWFEAYNINDETGSIYKTTDGGQNWILQSSNYSYIVLSDIWFADSLTGYTAGSGQLSSGFVYKTTDGGDNWNLSIGADTAIMTYSLSFINRDTGWAAGSNILKTTNGGVSWQEQLNIEPYFFTYVQFVDDQTGWASSYSLYKTTDGGNSWFQQSATGSTRTFFADTLNGWMINGSGSDIFHTSDGGDNWILQNSNTNEVLNDIFFADQLEGWAIGYNGTILHTVNGGTPVELVSFTAEADVNDVVLNWETATEKNNRGFEVEKSQKPAGDEVSSKGGSKVKSQKWENIGFVEGNGTSSEMHLYSYVDRNVNPGKYIYRLKQVDFDGSFEYSNEVEVEVTAPLKFALEQNYPNPFNPVTTISYELPVKSVVILKVYSTLGEEVAALVNEEKPAGSYQVEFNGSNLPSGVYIYRLTAGNYIAARKLILLK